MSHIQQELMVDKGNMLFIADLERARKVQQGEKTMFTEIYHEHLGRMYAVCLRMLGNIDDAKDATQKAVIQAWTTMGSYRGESPLSAWLHRIAVRTSLDHLRSRRRSTARLEFSDLDEVVDGSPSRNVDESMDLDRAIALLPTQARIVLVLHDIEGYKHEEIAEMLGVVPGTSKAQLHRARRLLREELK